MVAVLNDDLRVCVDCRQVIANDEWSWLDYHDWTEEEKDARRQQIVEGISRELPAQWVMGNDYEEFSHCACDCCGDRYAGSRFAATLLES